MIAAVTGGAVYNGLPLFKAVVINEIGIEQSPIFVGRKKNSEMNYIEESTANYLFKEIAEYFSLDFHLAKYSCLRQGNRLLGLQNDIVKGSLRKIRGIDHELIDKYEDYKAPSDYGRTMRFKISKSLTLSIEEVLKGKTESLNMICAGLKMFSSDFPYVTEIILESDGPQNFNCTAFCFMLPFAVLQSTNGCLIVIFHLVIESGGGKGKFYINTFI